MPWQKVTSSNVFIFKGMSTTNGEKTCLGTLVYNQDSAAFQTFKLSVSKCVIYGIAVMNIIHLNGQIQTHNVTKQSLALNMFS